MAQKALPSNALLKVESFHYHDNDDGCCYKKFSEKCTWAVGYKTFLECNVHLGVLSQGVWTSKLTVFLVNCRRDCWDNLWIKTVNYS